MMMKMVEVMMIGKELMPKSTCDPGDILENIQKCRKSKIRCSVIWLAAEMFIFKHLCQETGGTYSIALDEAHFKEIILEHAPPPPAIAEYATPNLIKLGFPQRAAEGSIAICTCHDEAKEGDTLVPDVKHVSVSFRLNAVSVD